MLRGAGDRAARPHLTRRPGWHRSRRLGRVQRDDDEAWRAIVDNYGERARLEEPAPEARDRARPEDQAADAGAAGPAEPEPLEGTVLPPRRSEHPADDPSAYRDPIELQDHDDRFVPPVPPPLPRPRGLRAVAWAGVFGSPAVLLICLLVGISLPQLLAYVLVAGFVGGFVYLVWQMPRGPRDPFDDGAVV